MRSATHIETAAAQLGRRGGAAGKGSPARKAAAIKAAHVRWGHAIYDESSEDMQFKCHACGATNKINIGKALGSRKSAAKTRAARENAQKGGRPSQWDDSIRAKAVDMLMSSGKTAVEISSELGIPPWTLSRWKVAHLKQAEIVTPKLPPPPVARDASFRKAARAGAGPKPTDR